MKIAIVSDTHDNLANIKKAIDLMKKEKVEVLLHCGDISTQETLDEIAKNFFGEFHFVLGNMEEKKFPEEIFAENFKELKTEDKKISFTHFPDIAKELAKSQNYDIVFYGHTHKPWEETLRRGSGRETRLVNPGNLAGIWYRATFAIYDTKTDKLELKILDL